MNPEEYRVMRSVEEDHWWYRGLRSILGRELHKIEGIQKAMILDAGCGTGANARMIRREFPGAWVLGLDQATAALEEVRPPRCQADVNRLPLQDNVFDVVVAMDLLGQEGVRFEKAVPHFFRVLKPGGVLLLNVPSLGWLAGEHDAAVHVTRRFDPLEIRQGLVHSGFEKITLQFWNFLLLLPMWIRRRVGRGIATEAAHSDLELTHGVLNTVLAAWMEVETRWTTAPLGSSIFSTARKPHPR